MEQYLNAVRWDERQRLKVAQEEIAKRNVQKADDEIGHNWTASCEGIAKQMFKYLEDSGVRKVSTRELKEQVLSPDESSVNTVRIARQTRSERGPQRQYGEIRGASERAGGAGEALPGPQGGSALIDTDVAMSASSRMAQDADEAKSESSWTALAQGKERRWWSIDLEGEMEKLEVVGPWSGTEGGSVDPKGKMGHRSARAKAAKEESEKLKEAEMKVGGERKVLKSKPGYNQKKPKTTYVRHWQSARKKQRIWARCSEKALRYWQTASMVLEEGGEAHTINLCEQCYSEQFVQQGKPRPKMW